MGQLLSHVASHHLSHHCKLPPARFLCRIVTEGPPLDADALRAVQMAEASAYGPGYKGKFAPSAEQLKESRAGAAGIATAPHGAPPPPLPSSQASADSMSAAASPSRTGKRMVAKPVSLVDRTFDIVSNKP